MKIVFTKNHPIGIPKGTVQNIQEKQALEMIEGGYAKEISDKEYEVGMKAYREQKSKEAEEAKKESEESNGDRFQLLNDNTNEEEETEEEEETDDREFLKVTEEDLENNPDFSDRGVKEGDEVLLDGSGQPVRDIEDGFYMGRDGKLGKSQPSSEATSEDVDNTSNNSGDGGDGSSEDTEPKYHTLTQEDLDADSELSNDGVVVGDEIELQDDGDFAVGEDGKVIKKPVEASK